LLLEDPLRRLLTIRFEIEGKGENGRLAEYASFALDVNCQSEGLVKEGRRRSRGGVQVDVAGKFFLVLFFYSNVSRGLRQKENQDNLIPCVLEPDANAKPNWIWARLIQKIHECVFFVPYTLSIKSNFL